MTILTYTTKLSLIILFKLLKTGGMHSGMEIATHKSGRYLPNPPMQHAERGDLLCMLQKDKR